MLLLSVQKKEIAQKILEGNYHADFWKSDYACLDTNFSKKYAMVSERLNLTGSDAPIWAWAGTPFIEFHKAKCVTQVYVCMFLDIPENRIVFSDYDKYCGDSYDFFISRKEAIERVRKGDCIQACVGYVKPDDVLLQVDYKNILDDESKSVECFYNSWRMISTYQSLVKMKYLKSTSVA